MQTEKMTYLGVAVAIVVIVTIAAKLTGKGKTSLRRVILLPRGRQRQPAPLLPMPV